MNKYLAAMEIDVWRLRGIREEVVVATGEAKEPIEDSATNEAAQPAPTQVPAKAEARVVDNKAAEVTADVLMSYETMAILFPEAMLRSQGISRKFLDDVARAAHPEWSISGGEFQRLGEAKLNNKQVIVFGTVADESKLPENFIKVEATQDLLTLEGKRRVWRTLVNHLKTG